MKKIEEEIAIIEAAMAGDVDAQLLYGKMLCGLADRVVLGVKGIEVVRYWDISNEGMSWLKSAAESGSKEAEELLLRIKNHEVPIVTEPECLFKKAMRYISGEGVGRNLAKAAEVLLDAADVDSKYKMSRSDVYRELAELCSQVKSKVYMFGDDPIHWLARLASAGDGETQHMLACVECEGKWNEYPYDDENYTEGFRWLKVQADAGVPELQWQYGNILLWAGSLADLAGLDYLKRACESGCAAAAYWLGVFYGHDADWGEGFHPDKREANKWFEKAVELGSVEAADALSDIIYLQKRDDFKWDGDEKHSDDFDKLFQYTKIAAAAGYAYAKVRLAVLYAIGIGVAVDTEKALALIRETYFSYPSYAAEKCLKMVNEERMTIRKALYECRNLIG